MNRLFIGLISIILIYFNAYAFAQSIYDTGSNVDQPSQTSNSISKQKPEEYKSKVGEASEKVMTALSQELQQQLASIPNLTTSTTTNIQTTSPTSTSTSVTKPSTTTTTTTTTATPPPTTTTKPAPTQTPYTGFGSGTQNPPASGGSNTSKFNVY